MELSRRDTRGRIKSTYLRLALPSTLPVARRTHVWKSLRFRSRLPLNLTICMLTRNPSRRRFPWGGGNTVLGEAWIHMRYTIVGGVLAAVMALGATSVRADEDGTEINLASLNETSPESSAVWDDIPLQDVASRLSTSSKRMYVSAMIGPSFGQFGTTAGPSLSSSDTIFNGGGALGLAIDRPMGQLRMEVEGMGRGTYDAGVDGAPPGLAKFQLTNNWSAMTNAWRDLMLTENFGIYGGGGIGAGGYLLGVELSGGKLYTNPAAGFAWQAGGGVLWNITDRLTFDAGYRFYQIASLQQGPLVTPNQFQSNEVMFTLRLYEPFRGLLR